MFDIRNKYTYTHTHTHRHHLRFICGSAVQTNHSDRTMDMGPSKSSNIPPSPPPFANCVGGPKRRTKTSHHFQGPKRDKQTTGHFIHDYRG